MVRFRGFDGVGGLDWRHAVARPAARGLLGLLVGGGKHRGMDCRCTREPSLESSLGLVSRMVRRVGRSRHISMARPAAAAVPGHLVVISKLCGLGRRFFHLRGPPGVPGTVLRGRFWGRDRGNNRDCAGLAAAAACRNRSGCFTSRRITTRWSGPGMRRRTQEEMEIGLSGRGCDGAIPGRSARSR